MPLRLTLLRHAKSNWDVPGLDDFERDLNARGMRDAPMMGQLLKRNNFSPQVIYASSARRAINTANQIAGEIGIEAAEVRLRDDFYLASAEYLLSKTIEIAADYDNILLIGHNPGMTELANLVGDARIDNLPTCGVISIVTQAPTWQELATHRGKTDWCLWPKKDLKP
jgi:phosphohistidine phosphatase